MSKDQSAADWYPQHDNLRIDALEKCIRDGSFASILNDIVAVCQHAYATFGTGPALRTAIDGCLHIEFPPADPPQDDLVREANEYLTVREDVRPGPGRRLMKRLRDRIVEQDNLYGMLSDSANAMIAEIAALRAQLAACTGREEGKQLVITQLERKLAEYDEQVSGLIADLAKCQAAASRERKAAHSPNAEGPNK